MIEINHAILIALKAIVDVFGMDYVKPRIRKVPTAQCVDNNTLWYWIAFESEDTRPDLPADRKGWTVQIAVDVDLETGEATVLNYELPDGTQYFNRISKVITG